MSTPEQQDPLTEQIIGTAIEVHRVIGPGVLESYEECMCHELHSRGLRFNRQVQVPLVYKGTKLECQLRIDLLAEKRVVAELKAVEKLLGVLCMRHSYWPTTDEVPVGCS
jgi:GxxExxY protein